MFPLLKLSIIPIRFILRYCDIYSVLQFSKILEDGICVQIKRDIIYIRFKKEEEMFGGWIVEEGRIKTGDDVRQEAIQKFEVQTFLTNYMASRTQTELYLTAEAILAYLVDLFRCRIRHIYLLPDGIRDPKEMLKLRITRVEDFIIEGENAMKNEDLQVILESVNVSKETFVKIRTDQHFNMDANKMKSEVFVFVENSPWSTREKFLTWNPPKLLLLNTVLEPIEIIEFVNR